MQDRVIQHHERTDGGNALARRDFLKSSVGALAGGIGATPALAQPTGNPHWFPGFRRTQIETSGTIINLVVGGSGPPILLLHGYPSSHILWRKVGPELAKDFTVVAADLRGYGDSGRPADGENHFGYCKRAMAQDMVEVMAKLGFTRFAVAGHDRGGRVVHRMALDHPDTVTKLVVMDILPSYYTFEHVDRRFATNNWYWFFLLEPSPFPETMIANSLEAYLKRSQARLIPYVVPEEVFAEYVRGFRTAGAIHAYCEDYRAGATIDLVHDEADRHRKVACPTLVLWGARGFRGQNYDPLAIWRDYASNVSGKGMPSGHHIVDEAPAETVAELRRFFAA